MRWASIAWVDGRFLSLIQPIESDENTFSKLRLSETHSLYDNCLIHHVVLTFPPSVPHALFGENHGPPCCSSSLPLNPQVDDGSSCDNISRKSLKHERRCGRSGQG